MELKTTDLCDAHPDKVQISEPIGFKDYGGKKYLMAKFTL